MGLLDFLNSDEGQLGLNMLAAGGPSTVRMSDGQRMAGAVAATNAARSAQSDAALKKAQLAEALQKTEVEKFGLQRLQDWQKLTMGDSSPTGQPSAPAPVNTSGGLIGSMQGNAPAPTGQPGMPPQGQPAQGQPAPAMSSSVPQGPANAFRFGLPGIPDGNSRAIAASLTPGEYMKMYADKAGPQTDSAKLLAQAGIDPNSALGRQFTQGAMAKNNYIAPANVRPGGYTVGADGTVKQFPHVPDGFTATQGGDGQFRITPVEGGIDAIAAQEKAKTLGVGQATPTVRYDNGIPKSSTKANDVAFANGLQPEGGITTNLQGSAEDVRRLIAGVKNPQDRANMEAGYARQLTGGGATPQPSTPEQIPGAVPGATLSQEELSAKGKLLATDNASANTVLSRLGNIRLLAPGAITGAESSRRDFMNGLLSLGGFKGATDSKTASDLVDKNSAQIVTALRMGQGGAGTDALQALLGSANPSRHMTVEAINDAVDQLAASQRMNQAKSKLLSPHVFSRDPVGYGTKEQAFDQAADPRLFQMNSLPPDKQADFIKSLSPADAKDLMDKRQQLKSMGVF